MNVPEIFGTDVFNEAVMKQRLSSEIYDAWKQCIRTGSSLPLNVANEIAEIDDKLTELYEKWEELAE